MNEENNVQTPVTPTPVTPQPEPTVETPATPVESVQTTPMQDAPAQPIMPTVPPVQPVQETQPATGTPVAQETTVQPVQEVTPVETVQPVQEVTPTEAIQPTPVAETVTPTPVVEETPSVQPTVASVAPQETSVESVPVQTPTSIDGSAVTENSLNSGSSDNGLSSMNNMSGDISSVGFVPTGEVVKKKPNKLIIMIILLIVLVILGLVGYFVIYPYVVKTYVIKPKVVYTETIKGVTKNINDTVSENLYDKGIYDIKVSLDSNVSQLKNYTDYTYGVNLGIDPSTKAVQYGITLVRPSGTESSYFNYLKDGKMYQRYSDYESLIYTGLVDSEDKSSMLSYDNLLKMGSKVKKDDVTYLVNKISDLIIDSIDEEKLSKEDASIQVNGENIKVLAHKYVMDEANQERTIKYIVDGILNDDKSMEILSSVLEIDKSTLKDNVNELLKSSSSEETEDKENHDFEIIIYTYGNHADVIGYAIETKKNANMHYYAKDNYLEFYSSLNVEDIETKETKNQVFKAIGKKSGGNTNVTVTLDDKEIAKLTVRSFDKKKIDLDYEVTVEGTGKYTGIVKYTNDTNDKRTKISSEFSLNINGDKIAITADLTHDWDSDVANINTREVEEMKSEQLVERRTTFLNSLSDTPIGALFQTTDGLNEGSILNYYLNDQRYIEPIDDETIINEALAASCTMAIQSDGYYTNPDGTITCSNNVCSYLDDFGSSKEMNCME